MRYVAVAAIWIAAATTLITLAVVLHPRLDGIGSGNSGFVWLTLILVGGAAIATYALAATDPTTYQDHD